MKKGEQDPDDKNQHTPESGDTQLNADENLGDSEEIQQTPREELSHLQSVDYHGDSLEKEVTIPLANQDDKGETCAKSVTQPSSTKEATYTIVQTDFTNEPEISVTMKNNEPNVESFVAESEHQLKFELSFTGSKSNEMQSFSIQIASLQDLIQHHITIWSHAKNSIKDTKPVEKLELLRDNLLSVIEYIDDAVKDNEKYLRTNSLIFDKASTSATNQHQMSNAEKPDQNWEASLFTLKRIPEPSTSHHAEPDNTPPCGPDQPSTESIVNLEMNEDDTSTPVNKDTMIVPKKLLLSNEESEKDSEDEISSIKSYSENGTKERDSVLSLSFWANQVNSFNSIKTGESSSSNNLDVESTSVMVNSQSTLETVDFEKSTNSILDEDNIHGLSSEPTQFELDISIHEDTVTSVYQSALYDLDSASSLKDLKSVDLDSNDVLLSDNSQRTSLVEEKDDTVASELLISEVEGSIQDETDIESSLSESISQNLKTDESKITLAQSSETSQGTMPIVSDSKTTDGPLTLSVLFDPNRINPLKNVEDFRPTPPFKQGEPRTINKPIDTPVEKNIYYFKPEWMLGMPEPFLCQEHDTKANDKVLQQVEDDQLSSKNKELLPSSLEQHKSSLEQKPPTLSALSDFNYQNLEEMKVIHSTPVKEDKSEPAQSDLSSTYSEVSKDDGTQGKKSVYKSYQNLESSPSSVEESSEEEFQITLEDTETQVNWVWLPAHIKDLTLPSTCCYQILPNEDTHSEISSRADEIEQISIKTPSTELKTKDVQIGPELNPEFKQLELDIPKREVIAIGDQAEPESEKTSETSAPDESKSILAEQFVDKGWKNNEYGESFLTLNKIIYGFYDLFDAQSFELESALLSTIYKITEASELIYVDSNYLEKIRQYVESLTEARVNGSLYYSLGSVTTCTSINPYTFNDEFFVQGKYKLMSDQESNPKSAKVTPRFTEPTSSCYLPLILEEITELPEETIPFQEKIMEDPEKVTEASEETIKLPEDTDLLNFCLQEMDKFPKEKLGIRFKQIIKYNGQILFDCRCNYRQLPPKLRRKYEVSDYLLLEFHHLIIPKQRQVYFSLHYCKHTIYEIQQILKITGKLYMDENIVKVIMLAYRCSFVQSQLTQASISKTSKYNIDEDIGEGNLKDKFMKSGQRTKPGEVRKKKRAPISSTATERLFEESSDDDFINLQDLEESMNKSLHQLPSRHAFPDDSDEDTK